MIRTLAVHTGGIGDLLLACDAIARMAEEGPVELLGQPGRLELVVAGGVAAAAHSLHRADFDSVFSTPSSTLKDFLSRYDRAVVWMRDDGAIEQSLKLCGVNRVVVRPGLPPENWSAHASHYYLSCLGHAPGEPVRLRIEPGSTRADVVLHPGSGGLRKNWPMEHFRELTDRLMADGRDVAWLIGPAEESVQAPSGVPVICEQSLVTVASRLAAARVFVGNDSGMTHLAAAVGCPTVAVFGPTDPAVWAPRGERVKVLRAWRADAPAWPMVAEVVHAVYDQPLFG